MSMVAKPSVAVVGAGAFGTWIAWALIQRGCRVTLVDAFGPGNSRASSGGETRVLRTGYGDQEIYTHWAMRSIAAWKELDQAATGGASLFHETGVLWIGRQDDSLTRATEEVLLRTGMPHESLDAAELERRWPQIRFGHEARGVFEPKSGTILARRAVECLARRCGAGGARFVRAQVKPPDERNAQNGRLLRVECTASHDAPSVGPGAPSGAWPHEAAGLPNGAGARISGHALSADAFVFACGPWLPKLFAAPLGEHIFVTRQEVYYFGTPPGNSLFSPPRFPTWVDFREEVYGIPDLEGRGLKIGLDRHGASFDPEAGDRLPGQTLSEVRELLSRKFPAMAGAPLLGGEVCQYENTSSGDFLLDRHPDWPNVILAGGGSGHGFKHGPAVGEEVARLLLDDGTPEARFALASKSKVQRRAVY